MNNEIMKASDSKKGLTEEIKGTISEVINQIKKLVKEGNARRLIIEDKKGKILFQTQLTTGVAGTALITAMAPVVSAIAMFALFMNDVKIIVEKYPEEENKTDELEVEEAEAEVIEVQDEEEEESDSTSSAKDEKEQDDEGKADKTVGKKKNDNK